jgi:hypothetical protein
MVMLKVRVVAQTQDVVLVATKVFRPGCRGIWSTCRVDAL